MIHKLTLDYKSIRGLEAHLIFDAADKQEARKSFEKFLDMTELHETQYAGHSLINTTTHNYLTSDTIAPISISNFNWDSVNTVNTFIVASSNWEEATDIALEISAGDTVA